MQDRNSIIAGTKLKHEEENSSQIGESRSQNETFENDQNENCLKTEADDTIWENDVFLWEDRVVGDGLGGVDQPVVVD